MIDRKLGPDFGKLWWASGISGFGDGVYASALPLLAAALTSDPIAVSAAMVAEWLPWLLFGLVAGAFLDRWDRIRTMWIVDAGRLLIVGGLAVVVLLDLASIPVIMAAGFLLGTGKVLVDIAAQAAVPAMVSRDPARLSRANARLLATNMLCTQFAGPPLGGLLFGVSAGVPFLVDAVSFGAASSLVAAIRSSSAGPAASSTGESVAREHAGARLRAAGQRFLGEVREGLNWLATNRVLRTMTALVAGVNLVGAMCQATLVLFVQKELGLGNVGYGVILACMAVGGAIGSVAAGKLTAMLGAASVSLGAFYLIGAATLGVGLASAAWVCGLLMAVNGLSAVAFNVVFNSLRQELVPDRLLGRTGGVVLLLCFGAMPVGGLLGGVLAHIVGLRAPFLVAGALIPLLALAATPIVTNKAIEMARTEVDSRTSV